MRTGDYELRHAIRDAFDGRENYGSSGNSNASTLLQDNAMFKYFMEVPMDRDEFDIPAFLLYQFKRLTRDCLKDREPYPDKIVLPLYAGGYAPNYKTIGPLMNRILRYDFFFNRLISINLEKCPSTYYATLGAIFNQGFVPIAMQTWTLRKETQATDDGMGRTVFRMVRPNLWVNPDTYENREDEVQRFVVNKMMKALIGYKHTVYSHNLPISMVCPRGTAFATRVIIDYPPFRFKLVEYPSISLRNEDLLDLALRYKEEVVQ